VFWVRAIALTGLAVGLAWTVVRRRRQRLAVARLVDELAGAPPLGSLRTALADTFGDVDLEVVFWLPRDHRYVDASGRPADPRTDRRRATTTISRRGEPVAVVVHDHALSVGEDLERQIGSAARLAIDNERLRAEVLAQLEDLRSSRGRIVATADSARRRLERDLHDGAQQRLLAVTYELTLAGAESTSRGDEKLAALLTHAVEDARTALAELRELAHGIFPAILDEAGLGAALWTLADRAPVPVEITHVPEERSPRRRKAPRTSS